MTRWPIMLRMRRPMVMPALIGPQMLLSWLLQRAEPWDSTPVHGLAKRTHARRVNRRLFKEGKNIASVYHALKLKPQMGRSSSWSAAHMIGSLSTCCCHGERPSIVTPSLGVPMTRWKSSVAFPATYLSYLQSCWWNDSRWLNWNHTGFIHSSGLVLQFIIVVNPPKSWECVIQNHHG